MSDDMMDPTEVEAIAFPRVEHDARGAFIQRRMPVIDGRTGNQIGTLDGVKIYVDGSEPDTLPAYS